MFKFYLSILIIAAAITAQAGEAAAEGNGSARVALQLKWYHQFQFAGYYAAKEKGFYDAAGLDVEILEGGPAVRVQEVVASGKADFGVLGSELVALRAQGIKCVVLAPIMQHSIRTIIASKSKSIFSPHDLIGKALMLNTNELPEFEAMFLNEGVRLGDLNIIEKNRQANQEFMAGRVDAINGSLANQPYLFLKKGVPYTLIKPINYGIDFYGDTLFAMEQTVRKKTDLVRAFMTASFNGWNYAFDHPQELIDLIREKYNAKKTRDHLEFEQRQLRDLIHPDLVEIGHNNPERWHRIKETYQKLGIVPADFSLAGFFYKDYLETDALWIRWLGYALAIVSVVSVLVLMYNFQLRKHVKSITGKIQQRSEYLRITLHSIGDAVISTDRSGKVMTMNPIAETLTGWQQDQARGEDLERVFHIVNAATQKRVDNPVKKVLETGRIMGLANHTLLISKGGKTYQIADSAAPMRDAQENTIGVVLVFRDVTSEYESMKQIVNLGKFPSENPNPVMRVTPDGILRYANRGSRSLLNHWGCKIDGPLPGIWQERVAQAVAENAMGQYDEAIPEGFFSLVITPVKTEAYANIYGMDITERKRAEEQRKALEEELRQSHKLEAIGIIAGGIAHDFNNILGIILGNTELALQELSEYHPVADYLKEVETAGFRARDVVKQLLQFSRKSEEAKEKINIRESLLEAIRLMRASIPTSIDIVTDIPDENQIIIADSTQFQQVLINLCTNAAHAMEDEGGVLSVGLSEFETETLLYVQFQEIKPGRYVQLTVRDTGNGIDPEIREKIFDPYFTTKEVGKGTGMGLAVVMGIVKNHDGVITVNSRPGQGTVIKVLFPKAEGEAARPAVPEAALPGRGRILFVDDEAGMLKIGKAMLEKLGYSVETADDPLKALEIFRMGAGRFDLVITDMTMPHMDGDRLVEKIRETDPRVPVILATGFNSKINRETAWERGIQKYVEKPFDSVALARAVAAALGKDPAAHPDSGTDSH